ncbi:MAG TPA: hypothetical protein PKC21_01760 [Oligoflexia bacterium]|nr:hypothetical protein [Oligoflexia bacterium]HMR24056.1 hypothetical protein [Oligoflexia bacterium]
MFKKLVLSLILAGATLSFAQSLSQAKAEIQRQINDKGLNNIVEETVSFLSNSQFFTFEDGEFTSKVYYTDQLTASQKQQIEEKYAAFEEAVFNEMTADEQQLIRDYVASKGSDGFYDDSIIFNHINNNLKPYYLPILKDIGELDWSWSHIYSLTPCYPYDGSKSYVDDGENYCDLYNKKPDAKSSTLQIAYSMAQVGIFAFVMECKNYPDVKITDGVYVKFLNKLRNTSLMTLTDSSMARFLNFDDKSTSSLELIKNCDRMNDLIDSIL